MKIFGIKFRVEKVPKHPSFEEFQDLSQYVLGLESRLETVRKAGESLRIRFQRAKIPENGHEQEVQESFHDQPSVPKQFKTGDPWPG